MTGAADAWQGLIGARESEQRREGGDHRQRAGGGEEVATGQGGHGRLRRAAERIGRDAAMDRVYRRIAEVPREMSRRIRIGLGHRVVWGR